MSSLFNLKLCRICCKIEPQQKLFSIMFPHCLCNVKFLDLIRRHFLFDSNPEQFCVTCRHSIHITWCRPLQWARVLLAGHLDDVIGEECLIPSGNWHNSISGFILACRKFGPPTPIAIAWHVRCELNHDPTRTIQSRKIKCDVAKFLAHMYSCRRTIT
jgi:hypothetical protein